MTVFRDCCYRQRVWCVFDRFLATTATNYLYFSYHVVLALVDFTLVLMSMLVAMATVTVILESYLQLTAAANSADL